MGLSLRRMFRHTYGFDVLMLMITPYNMTSRSYQHYSQLIERVDLEPMRRLAVIL